MPSSSRKRVLRVNISCSLCSNAFTIHYKLDTHYISFSNLIDYCFFLEVATQWKLLTKDYVMGVARIMNYKMFSDEVELQSICKKILKYYFKNKLLKRS